MQSCARMNPEAVELQARTQRFATAVIKFFEALPKNHAAQQIAEQLVDSAGSTDSNYRATCRARSPIEDARDLIQESHELTAIFVASRKTAQRRKAERERLQKELKASNRSRRAK